MLGIAISRSVKKCAVSQKFHRSHRESFNYRSYYSILKNFPGKLMKKSKCSPLFAFKNDTSCGAHLRSSAVAKWNIAPADARIAVPVAVKESPAAAVVKA